MSADRTIVYGKPVATIPLEGRRSLMVRTHERADTKRPEVLIYLLQAGTPERRPITRFIGAASPEAAQELVDALRRGLGEIERARPSGPGVAPGSWREQQAMGTAGDGAPTMPQRASSCRRGDQ